MNRCQICGKKNGSLAIIRDKDYGIYNNEAKVCPKCFNHWAADDREILNELIRRKLKDGI